MCKCTMNNICNFIKYTIIGFFALVIVTSLIVNMANQTTNEEQEQIQQIKICVSNFVDNLKHKEILSDSFNVNNLCQPNMTPKIKYHLLNFNKCVNNEYVGQSYNVFQPTLECRDVFLLKFFQVVVSDFQELFKTMTPTLETILESVCDSPQTIQKLTKIVEHYNCL